MPKKKTTEQFIEEARKVHGDKYDYSKVVYVNKTTKVCIICKEHGDFWQTPYNHLRGQNCRKCEVKKRAKWNYETCYEEAKKYKTKTEFQKACNSAYHTAWKNGWIDCYTWFEKKNINQTVIGITKLVFKKQKNTKIEQNLQE